MDKLTYWLFFALLILISFLSVAENVRFSSVKKDLDNISKQISNIKCEVK